MHLTPADILAAEKELCQRSFAYFVKRAWPVLEPSTQLKWGWAMDAICTHLQAITEGEIKNLLANVPPGSMKSLLVNVFWPAWEWGPRGLAHLRYIGVANEFNLAVRDSLKSRDLIKSKWFQRRWPVNIRKDLDGKNNYGNDKTGVRWSRTFKNITGARGNRVLIDDPIGAEDANSITELRKSERIMLETLPTRVNDLATDSFVVIMQRLHELDPSGTILAKDLDYVHLCIPMEYEPNRQYYTPVRPRGYEGDPIMARKDPRTNTWHAEGADIPDEVQKRIALITPRQVFDHDPRQADGELMFPERFGPKEVAELKRTLGSYGAAGQLQQRPSPRGGGIIKEKWWSWYTIQPKILWRLIFADTAQKEKQENDFSVFQCWGMCDDGRIALLDQIRGKWEGPELERNARSFWAKHRAAQNVGPLRQMLVEDKVSGTGLIQGLARAKPPRDGNPAVPAIPIRGIQRDTDKISRAHSASPQIEAGNVLLPMEAEWVTDYVREFNDFPAGANDDQCDPTFDAIEKMLGGVVQAPAPVGAPEGVLGPSVVE